MSNLAIANVSIRRSQSFFDFANRSSGRRFRRDIEIVDLFAFRVAAVCELIREDYQREQSLFAPLRCEQRAEVLERERSELARDLSNVGNPQAEEAIALAVFAASGPEETQQELRALRVGKFANAFSGCC